MIKVKKFQKLQILQKNKLILKTKIAFKILIYKIKSFFKSKRAIKNHNLQHSVD